MKTNAFISGIQQLKPFYHGSNVDVDNILLPQQKQNHANNKLINVIFVSPDINYAKMFAIRKCLGGDGASRVSFRNTGTGKNKLFLEKISDTICPNFYIYTVYQTPDNKFIKDANDEFYSEKPLIISNKEKYNLIQELNNLNCDVYVFDTKITTAKSINNAIEAKQYHRVIIADVIQNNAVTRD